MQICITVGDGEQVVADLLVPDGRGGMQVSPEYVVELAPGNYLAKRFALGRESGQGDGSAILMVVINVEDIGDVVLELDRFPKTEIKKVPEEPVTDA